MANSDGDTDWGDQDWEDIGHDHRVKWSSWSPDRDLNPQYVGVPDCDRAMLLVTHPRADGRPGRCASAAAVDSAPPAVTRDLPVWQVESWEPLTLSPSLLCRACGDHGFIRDGRWIPA